jgi:hypothetical protein
MEQQSQEKNTKHYCEVCNKETDYFLIEGFGEDEFWYCQDHAQIDEPLDAEKE